MMIRRSFNCICPLFFAALLGIAPHLPAQQPSQTTAAAVSLPIYDVVSIHENKSGSGNMNYRWGDGSFTATNVTLPMLLMNAYNIRDTLIFGLPGWTNSFNFDIKAKVSDADIQTLKKLSPEQNRAMMIALLKDRFHLQTHIETKMLPVYDLVIARGGSKLKEDPALPSKDEDPKPDSAHKQPPGSFLINDGQMIATAIPISMLAANLAFRAQRNIIDKTGLTGKYDINLKWTPPELEGKPDGLTDNPPPDLFTALQEQLGLKLEPSKGPVQTLVVDHIEMPTAN